MRQTVATAAIFALFIMGVVIGAFGMHLVETHRMPWHGQGHAMPRQHHGPPHMLQGIEDELDLTAEQHEAIAVIIQEGHERASALRMEIAPRVQEEMAATHQRILQVLNPEQRRKLQELRPLRHRRGPRR